MIRTFVVMQHGAFVLLVSLVAGMHGVRFVQNASPALSVVKLLEDLQGRIKNDGKAEQESYDKFTCWIENALSEKAKSITLAKDTIESSQQTIVKLKGEVASHRVMIKKLEKSIAENKEAQAELINVRGKEHKTYLEETEELTQCLGALAKAIEVLAAGSKQSSKAFLMNIQQAQILSVVAGVRGVLKTTAAESAVSANDLAIVKHFVSKPEDFIEGDRPVMSAAQIANNPFGNYAPQSTQIQGILKSMQASFIADLTQAHEEEAEKKKGFDALMKTKGEELSTFESSLTTQEDNAASKTKTVADSETTRDTTKEQLAADQEFFAATKAEGAEKAGQWAKRSRLRTQELAGIAKAIAILSHADAKKTFEGAEEGTKPEKKPKELLQLSNVHRSSAAKVAARLQSLATRYNNFALLQAVGDAKAGHFDRVIVAIDAMMTELREEEQEDIAHRDRCEGKADANKNTQEDLKHQKGLLNDEVSRLTAAKEKKDQEVTDLGEEINRINTSMFERRSYRVSEKKAFEASVKDDEDAVVLVEKAIVTLKKFYQDNPVALVQKGAEQPKPETSWQSGDYTGRSEEAHGILEILAMIKSDLEKEVEAGRAEDTQDQVDFEKAQRLEQRTLDKTKAAKIEAESEAAELGIKIADVEGVIGQKDEELDNEEKEADAIKLDCQWVKETFTKRRDARKTEMDALVGAKAYLSGTEDSKVSVTEE